MISAHFTTAAAMAFILVVLSPTTCQAFQPAPVSRHSTTSLSLAGGNPLSNLFGTAEKDPNVPTNVFEIPTTDVKIGALQFLIQIHMMSAGNTPEKGTWFPKQNESGGLDLYFKDGTGMVTIAMNEYSIKAERYGSKPSLVYLLQESVLLHSVLDELNKTAFDEVEDIKEDKRLLRLKEADGIDKARSQLLPLEEN